MSDTLDRNTLLNLIRNEYGRIDALLAQLTDEEMVEPGVEDNWSVKDILAHLTDWQSYVTQRMRLAQQEERPARRQHPTDEAMDRINAEIYEQHRGRSLRDVRLAFHQSYRDVMKTLESLSDADLAPGSRFRELMGEPVIEHILDNTAEHYRGHAAEIRAWLDGRRPGRAGSGDTP